MRRKRLASVSPTASCAKARRARRPNSLAAELAAFPQAALLADRRSVLENSTLDDLADALRREGAGGYQAVFDEGVAGAARFAQGAGRHGKTLRSDESTHEQRELAVTRVQQGTLRARAFSKKQQPA